jgi:hypothetical protein
MKLMQEESQKPMSDERSPTMVNKTVVMTMFKKTISGKA